MPVSNSVIDTFIQLFDQNFNTIGRATVSSPSIGPESPHKILDLVTNWWSSFNHSERKRLIFYISGGILFFYISLPTIFPSFYQDSGTRSGKMFSRRPDKYVTGLINLTTDCFANSTLQSLAALPSLNNYLNDISKYHSTILGVCKSSAPELNPPSIPMHEALIDILYRLQETILTSRVISVWDFLHSLERIYKSKISRNQHDAHELLQLILETLNSEYLRIQKFVNKNDDVFNKVFQENGIPDFPFHSEISSKLICSRCGKKSSTNFDPMMILSMPVPQKLSIKIQTLISDTLKESIDDYSCLCCKINFILYNNKNLNLSAEDRKILSELKELVIHDKLLINDDLPKDQESYVDNYPGTKHQSVKSTVYKTTNLLIAPKILPIHLSRSIFENSQAWRNSCSVEFEEYINLTVDEIEKKEFDEKVVKKAKAKKDTSTTLDVNDDTDNESNGTESLPSTKHASSIIQEKPEDEFVDNASVVSDELEYHSDSEKSDSESSHSGISQNDEDDLEEDLDDKDKDIIAEGDDGTPSQRPMFKPSYSSEKFASLNNPRFNGNSSGTGISADSSAESNTETGTYSTPTTSVSDVLNDLIASPDTKATQITTPVAPTIATKTYRYKLRAVIRHQGSHLSGHYECYRRKPVFYKDPATGDYYTKFPKLVESRISRQEGMIAAIQNLGVHNDVSTSERSETEDEDKGRESEDDKSQTKTNTSVDSETESITTRPRRSSSLSKRFRSSFSSLKRSSRSSSFGFSNPPPVTLENQPQSDTPATTTPYGDSLVSQPDTAYSKGGEGSSAADALKTSKTKILSTSVKYPFWRISDTKIKEVSSINDLLNDSKAVYMIFYERVD